jgi:membrane complex biogenesis BtpA family protein
MARLIGVVHLPALPGSPRSRLSIDACIEHALRDATALVAGDADALIVENFHDVPFFPSQVPAYTVAAMTAVCVAIRREVRCEIGVNVLRNDAAAALGVAVACGAQFIRVNVHTGAMVTDQGILNGQAAETLRLRRALEAERIQIYADVLVKHAAPLGAVSLEDALRDTVERGLADAVIVSGTATGAPASPQDVRRATDIAIVPVYVGSGVTVENVSDVVPPAAGVIVGTSLKVAGRVENAVDVERVRALRAALDRTDSRDRSSL